MHSTIDKLKAALILAIKYCQSLGLNINKSSIRKLGHTEIVDHTSFLECKDNKVIGCDPLGAVLFKDFTEENIKRTKNNEELIELTRLKSNCNYVYVAGLLETDTNTLIAFDNGYGWFGSYSAETFNFDLREYRNVEAFDLGMKLKYELELKLRYG